MELKSFYLWKFCTILLTMYDFIILLLCLLIILIFKYVKHLIKIFFNYKRIFKSISKSKKHDRSSLSNRSNASEMNYIFIEHIFKSNEFAKPR